MLTFFKKIFLLYFTAYLVFLPLTAYSVPLQVDGSTNTTLDKARNNVPIVNIANPNSDGLSHNKFIHYNVGSEGLILNNSKQTNVDTQLGGIIFGNNNLTNNATLILNEVTSTNRSSLKGWTEVAGQKANLIIANPNGLTINGTGFINTSNITLTTGSATFNDNQFNGFTINGGDVLIEGAGLDVSNQDSASVYSHYLQLNSSINAKNLDIKLGQNIINESGNITQSSNSGQTQNLLLDTSALGGMYANRIMLIGTDQGLGVNLPPEVLASTGGIFIDNKGNISLQKMSAKGNIQITSNDEISVNSNIYSEQTLDIHAEHKINVMQGIVSAKNIINIGSEEFNNQSQVIAGLNLDFTQNSRGVLNINTTKVTNQGVIQATANLNLATNELDNQAGGSIVAGNDLSIKKNLNSNGSSDNTATNLITNAGTLHANNNQSLIVNTLNNSGDITATNKLNITATNMTTTSGKVSANDTNITADNLSIVTTALSAVNNMVLSISNLFTNQGTIQANQQLDISADTLNNQSDIIAKEVNIGVTTKATNTGKIEATQDLNLATNELDNQANANIIAGNNLNIKKSLDNADNTKTNLITNAGTLHANNNNIILATTLSNTKGDITASKDLNITSNDITTTEGKISANNTNITTNNLDSTDTNILSVNNLNLNIANLLTNKGKIQANQTLTLNAKTLDNQQNIVANTASLNTDDINNSGNILSIKNLNIINSNKFTNTQGIIQADEQLNLSTNELDNKAQLLANSINLTISTKTTNTGKIQATQDLNFATDELDNQANANIIAGNNLNIKKSLDNADNTKTNLITNAGTLHANNNQSIIVNTLNNSGDITATNKLNITATNMTTTSGKVSANDTNITADNLSIVTTALSAVNNMILSISNLFNNQGTIQANQQLDISADTLNNQSDIIANNLNINTDDIINSGNLSSVNNLVINNSNKLTNISTTTHTGTIQADNLLTLNTNELDNQANIIAKEVNIGVITKTTNQGIIQATANLNLATNELDNQAGGSIVAGNDLSIKKNLNSNGSSDNTATNLITNAGTLHANNNQNIIVNTLNNSGDITATNKLNITATNMTTTSGKVSANDTNITADNLSIVATALSAVNNMALSISNLFTNQGTIQANQQLDISTNTLNNHNLIVANNFILSTVTLNNHTSGIIHAKSNLTITANDLDNDNQISSDNILSITTVNDIDNQNAKIAALGDITIKANNFNNQNAKLIAYGVSNVDVEQNINNTNGDISAKSMILDTDSINVNNSKIYASEDLTIIIPHLDNTVGSNIGSGGDLTINARDYIVNNAELTANGDFDLITQGSLTNNNLISSEGTLSISANSLVNNNTISGGTGNSNINITGDIVNHSRISSKENLSVVAQNITNNGFFNAAQDLTLTTNNNLTNNQTLFAGKDMKLYVTNELHNTEDANIFAYNNLIIAKDTSNNKTNKIINDKATIQTYQGDIDIYAKLLENKTDIPSITGSYDADTQTIVGGEIVSENTVTKVTTDCGGSCRDEITTTIKRMVLNSRGAPAQLNSGGNMKLMVDKINNQYSSISATGDIHLASKVVDNSALEIIEVTTIKTKEYRNESYCTSSIGVGIGLGSVCLHWGNRVVHKDTTTDRSSRTLQTIASTIQAGGSITGNIDNLNNDNIQSGIDVSTTPNQTQNTDTTTNTQSINQNNVNVNAQTVSINTKTTDQQAVANDEVDAQTKTTDQQAVANDEVDAQTKTTDTQPANPTVVTQTPLPITLPTGTTGLFVQAKDPTSKYLIETNPEFTLYDNFISSDYLFKHIDFNPDEKLKRIGDGFYEQKLIRDQLLAQTGRRFLTKDITSDNAQYQQLMDNTITQQRDLELTPGISLSADQVAQLTQDIVWMEPQTITLADGTTTQALVPRVYIANASQYQVEGGRIIAGKDISLNVDQLKNAGLIKAGDNLSVSALDSILNQGGTLQADNTLTLLAGNDISNISANIQAKNITLTSIDGNINNTRFEQQADYSHTNTIDIKKVIGVQSNIIANNISLTTNKDINLAGSNLNAGNTLDLSANNVVLTTTQQVSVFDSGNAQNYLKENSTTNLKSQVKANNINIDVVEQVNIKGASIQADNQINIQSKVLDIASAKDTSFSELHSESKGDLFGGGHDDTTITSTSTNIQSTLQAKDINITSSLTQVQASKVKANTIKITTDLLNLVSDKDLDFKQVKTDSSGLLTKTITDKGHNKQTKIVAQLDATDQLNINNQQLTSTQQQLKQLSSADALNAQLAQQLKAQGITLNDIKISNSSWDESSTTLSGLGKIIVQLAANAIVPGAGGGFINAAMASVQTQLASAVLTAGITGNDLDIDPKAILKTALTAGANQYALDQYGASSIDADGLKTTTYNSEIDFSTNLQNGLQNTVITTTVSTAINGGSLADNLESNLANSILTTSTAKGANIIGTNKANLGEIGHKVAHAALGCAGAKIQGKDCSSGAVGAVSGEIIAEQLGKNADLSDKDVVAISRVGTAVVTQGLGKDVEVADKAGVNAVENNFLTVRKQIQYANEMNTCGKDKSCLANTKNKYNAEYNMKKQLLTQAKQKCLNNPLCRWTRQKHIIYNNLQNNRLFDNEITKTPDTIKTVNSRGRKLKNPVLIPGEYVSRVEARTKKDAIAVGEAGVTLLPYIGPVYQGGKFVINAIKDYQRKDGNYSNTIKGSIDIILPKILSKKAKISETSVNLIGAGVSLGKEINEKKE